MKTLVVFFVLVVCKEIFCSISASEEWEAFKLHFQKNYTNDDEEKHRNTIFMKNKAKIEKHNDEYEKGVHSYKMGINKFSDLEPHEFSLLLNSNNQRINKANQMDKIFTPNDTNLPKHIDWRKKGAVTSVKNQVGCRACWAFSAVGALEGQYFLKTGKLVSLSVQFLLDCTDSGSCLVGGLISEAFRALEKQGIKSEKDYPYEDKDMTCRHSEAKSITRVKDIVSIKQNEEDLKAAVATAGPISVCINAMGILHYSDGVFYDPSCNYSECNHAVLVVGYGTDKNGGDYWLVKNSWGKMWGKNGYIKMARNRDNNCHIASRASYPEVE